MRSSYITGSSYNGKTPLSCNQALGDSIMFGIKLHHGCLMKIKDMQYNNVIMLCWIMLRITVYIFVWIVAVHPFHDDIKDFWGTMTLSPSA